MGKLLLVLCFCFAAAHADLSSGLERMLSLIQLRGEGPFDEIGESLKNLDAKLLGEQNAFSAEHAALTGTEGECSHKRSSKIKLNIQSAQDRIDANLAAIATNKTNIASTKSKILKNRLNINTLYSKIEITKKEIEQAQKKMVADTDRFHTVVAQHQATKKEIQKLESLSSQEGLTRVTTHADKASFVETLAGVSQQSHQYATELLGNAYVLAYLQADEVAALLNLDQAEPLQGMDRVNQILDTMKGRIDDGIRKLESDHAEVVKGHNEAVKRRRQAIKRLEISINEVNVKIAKRERKNAYREADIEKRTGEVETLDKPDIVDLNDELESMQRFCGEKLALLKESIAGKGTARAAIVDVQLALKLTEKKMADSAKKAIADITNKARKKQSIISAAGVYVDDELIDVEVDENYGGAWVKVGSKRDGKTVLDLGEGYINGIFNQADSPDVRVDVDGKPHRFYHRYAEDIETFSIYTNVVAGWTSKNGEYDDAYVICPTYEALEEEECWESVECAFDVPNHGFPSNCGETSLGEDKFFSFKENVGAKNCDIFVRASDDGRILAKKARVKNQADKHTTKK